MCRSLSVALELLAAAGVRRLQERADEGHEIVVGKRLLQEVNRAEPGRAFPMSREMHSRQNDRARVRMTGAQIVEEFLAEIVSRIDIQHEEIGVLMHHHVLRLFQAVRDIDLHPRSGIEESSPNGGRQLSIRGQDQDSSGLWLRPLPA